MHRKFLIGAVIAGLINTAAIAGDMSAYAVNGPLGYFAQRLAPAQIAVSMPAPNDGDPAFWQPSQDEIAEFQAADLIILNGADYAKWVKTAALPRAKSIDTSKSYKDRLIEEATSVAHSHGSGDTHSHAGIAFTTWLDFSLAAEQSAAIAKAFQRKLPAQSEMIAANLAQLQADLSALDAEARALGEALTGVTLIASHPIYQYLSRAYALDLPSLTWEPDVLPDAEQLAELDALIAQTNAKFFLWEDEPIEGAAEAVAARGLTNLVFQTGNSLQPDQDFLALMRQGLSQLALAAKG